MDNKQEEKLIRLLDSNSESNRFGFAKEYKKNSKKVIGILSTYVPEEIITAAGMMPWRIVGTWKENISHARVYRNESSCSYCNHVLESLLNGDLDFLDGIIATDLDQDMLRLFDVIASVKKVPFAMIIHVPFVDSVENYRFFTNEIKELIKKIETFFGVQITPDSMKASIEIYNEMRTLLNKIYELRKREIPPLSGAEVLGLTTAAQIMPKELFNQELKTILPYLESRITNINSVHPRLLVTSEMLDNPAYLNLVEENCLVAMDDMDTGSRYFSTLVDITLKDPVYAIAKRYISRPGSPRMTFWDKEFKQILIWIKDYKIDGVMGLSHSWCYPQMFRMPYLIRKLEELGIPSISLQREYHLSNLGQLRTRIQAFLEMLPSSK